MPKTQFSDLVTDLAANAGFRRDFAANPGAALRARGFDPDLLALPDRIDLAKLEQRLSAMEDGRGHKADLQPGESLNSLTPQQIWDRFMMIELKDKSMLAPLGTAQTAATTTSAALVAVVAYGSSAAVSSASAQVAAVTSGRGDLSAQELGRLALLREISRSDASAMRFTIKAGGEAVDGLSFETMKAFLGKPR